MPNENKLPRIDRYTCKFENPVLEEKYLNEEWFRIKKGLNFGLIFISLVMLLDLYEAYHRMGGFEVIQLGFFVIIGLVAIFLSNSEKFKSKYYSTYLTVLFCGIHTFMIVQGFSGDWIRDKIGWKRVLKSMKNYSNRQTKTKIYREDTLSFTDISSYSTIIEHMSPTVAVEFLNEYFTAMHDVIEKHNGHILNYIGDSVMVVFGAPEELKDHEIYAVRCAVEMREKLLEPIFWAPREGGPLSSQTIIATDTRTGTNKNNILYDNIRCYCLA